MKDQETKKVYNLDEARENIRAYCVYQDRSHYEVSNKLWGYGLFRDAVDQLMTELIQDNYLNEERFARSFVRGKFNQKKWGRQKIRKALYPHKLSDYVMDKAFTEIDDEEYLQTLNLLLEKKDRTLSDKNLFVRRGKLADHLIRKGYEGDLVWDIIRNSND